MPTWASPGRARDSTCPVPRSRSAWGAPQYNPPSRFLDEIPAELVEWERELSGASAIGRRDQRPAVATLAARPGVRSPGNRPIIALSPGDRVTHDTYGLGTVVAHPW